MKMSAPVLRLTAWITLAALLAMLWSALAHGQMKTGTARLFATDICSSTGAVPAPGPAQETGEKGPQVPVRHCVFCTKQDLSHVLPSRCDPPLNLWSRVAPPVVMAADFPLAVRPWRNPYLRGPPSGWF